MKCLNLGCGRRYFEDWVNLDFVSSDPSVVAHDLTKGIPFANNSFDVVYHSHVLEHFSKADASTFIHECYRVLKKGGTIRVVVPDLEQIAREYLINLEQAKCGDAQSAHNYQWIMLELYDQAVRNHSGGEMASYWTQDSIENEEYVAERIGREFIDFRRNHVRRASPPARSTPAWKRYFSLTNYKRKLIRYLANNQQADHHLSVGSFRSRGEIHQWMYDEYSLGLLLKSEGFIQINRKSAYESSIPGWEKYRMLDIEEGQVRKPDSLFLEATK